MKNTCVEERILVITFNPHPLQVIKNKKNFLINTHEEKRNLLMAEGVDFFFEIIFDRYLSQLSPLQFSNKFFSQIAGLRKIFVGYNFTFGINKEGEFNFLKSSFKNSLVSVELFNEFRLDDNEVSSTQIRHYLSLGKIKLVNRLLGRKYFLSGNVIKSLGRGKRIGRPTINLQYNDDLCLPKRGVYATEVHVGPERFDSITNIGIRPTFNDNRGPSIETHILNFNQTLYSKKVKISFISRIRDEKKFPSPDHLVEQIKQDIEKRTSL